MFIPRVQPCQYRVVYLLVLHCLHFVQLLTELFVRQLKVIVTMAWIDPHIGIFRKFYKLFCRFPVSIETTLWIHDATHIVVLNDLRRAVTDEVTIKVGTTTDTPTPTECGELGKDHLGDLLGT